MNETLEDVLTELQDLWNEEYDTHDCLREQEGIRSSQVIALVHLLVRKGLFDES